MAQNEITILLRVKNMLSTAYAGVKQFGAELGGLLKKGALAAGAALAGLVAAGAKLVASYQVQAQAEARRNAALEATGFAAGRSAAELNRQAAALQKTTGVADEVVISMQGILAAFDLIRGDTFDRATVAAINLGVAMRRTGADSAAVEDAAKNLGMALQDPAEGMTRLRRSGILLTQAQQDQIKAMQAAGDLAGAQTILLDAVAAKYGNAAEQAHAAAGGIDDIKNMLSDAGEEMGKAIQENDTFRAMIDQVKKALEELAASGKLKEWVDATLAGLKTVADAVAALVPKIVSLGSAIKTHLGNIWGRGKQIGGGLYDMLHGGTYAGGYQRVGANNEAQKAAENQAKTQERIVKGKWLIDTLETNEAARLNKIAELKQKQLDLEKKIGEEKEHQTRLDEVQAKLAQEQKREAAAEAEAEKQQAKLEELQKQTVADWIAGRKKEKEELKAKADEAKKIAALEGKEKRGVGLSKRDKEFLEGAREKKAAEEFAQKMRFAAQQEQQKAQAEVKRLQQEAKDIANRQLTELTEIKKKLTTLLQAA